MLLYFSVHFRFRSEMRWAPLFRQQKSKIQQLPWILMWNRMNVVHTWAHDLLPAIVLIWYFQIFIGFFCSYCWLVVGHEYQSLFGIFDSPSLKHSKLKYATYNIGFMKVRMEGRWVKKKKSERKKAHHHLPTHTHHVWMSNKTAMSEWNKEKVDSNTQRNVNFVSKDGE